MRARRLATVFLVFVVLQSLVFAWPALAQTPVSQEPVPSPTSPSVTPPEPRLAGSPGKSGEPDRMARGELFARSKPAGAASPQAAAAPDVALGQPGVAYRYVQTWGDPNVPYFEDTIDLNAPIGVGVDGNNVWIAEDRGRRLMKYTSGGAFLMQIGHGGLRYALPDTDTMGFRDVAVDAVGNVWATDAACHVLQFDSAGQYLSQLFDDWNCGEGNDQFQWGPEGLAFDTAGRLYVSDTGNHRIQVLQADGTYVTTIGVTGVSGADNAHLNEPRHITIDANNRLYVADSANHRVQVYDVSAMPVVTHLATLGVTGVPGDDSAHLSRPYGAATDIGRNRIYVADRDNQRVQVFDYTTRAYVATISVGILASDVAVDAAGNIYAPNDWNGAYFVQQYSPAYALTRTYGNEAEAYLTDADHFFHPNDVAVASNGSLYIGEGDGRRLTKRTAAGALQWSIGVPGLWRGDNTGFDFVSGLDLDSAGRVYASDMGNNRVQIFTANGGYVATLGGSGGQGPYQFEGPQDVAIGPGDMIYVSDTGNHRVQVFNSSRQYVATIGQIGVCGSTNDQFCEPHSVDVDAAGNIYVVDLWNYRVQVFNASRQYVRTIGQTGVAGDDFGHLNCPVGVAVGADGRTFVADGWGGRIHVYDGTGAYLTTIGGGGGQRTGGLRDAHGLALDGAGNLYAAEYENHRVQKYAPGVPGWRQTNINGFGTPQNWVVNRMSTFNGHLYTGVTNDATGAGVWRTPTGADWTQVNTGGFGDTDNRGVAPGAAFLGKLYVGTWNEVTGGEVWRCAVCDGSDWARVVNDGLGDAGNWGVEDLVVFGSHLYAVTWNPNTGAEVWRSPSGNPGSWTQVNTDGFGDAANTDIWTATVHNGFFYASPAREGDAGAEVWRCAQCDGSDWSQINDDGFGQGEGSGGWVNTFGGHLYVSAGARIWRCASCDNSDWERVVDDGFGDSNNTMIGSMIAYANRLYAAYWNNSTGVEIWQTNDGVHWSQANPDGFGDSNNLACWGGAVFNNRLFWGTYNWANGAEVWQLLESRYLPLMMR